LRQIALLHTKFAKATCGSIRLQLLKIGAFVRISVRRIKFAMSSGCPVAAIWGRAATRLNADSRARSARPPRRQAMNSPRSQVINQHKRFFPRFCVIRARPYQD
jgi:hypothetical protein